MSRNEEENSSMTFACIIDAVALVRCQSQHESGRFVGLIAAHCLKSCNGSTKMSSHFTGPIHRSHGRRGTARKDRTRVTCFALCRLPMHSLLPGVGSAHAEGIRRRQMRVLWQSCVPRFCRGTRRGTASHPLQTTQWQGSTLQGMRRPVAHRSLRDFPRKDRWHDRAKVGKFCRYGYTSANYDVAASRIQMDVR